MLFGTVSLTSGWRLGSMGSPWAAILAVSWAMQVSCMPSRETWRKQPLCLQLESVSLSLTLCSRPSPEFYWRGMGWVFPIISQACWACCISHSLEQVHTERKGDLVSTKTPKSTLSILLHWTELRIPTLGFQLPSLSVPSSKLRKSRLVGKILNISSFGSQISKWLNNTGEFTTSLNKSKLYENPIICQCHFPPTH